MKFCKLLFCLLGCAGIMHGTDAWARIMMKPLINGNPVQMVVDTRTESTVLFAHAAKRIGLKWQMPDQAPAPGQVTAGISEACQFDNGSGPQAAVFPVADIPQYQQAGIDGVLSWDNMKSEILFLDGKQHQFSAIAAIPDFAKQWQTFPVEKSIGSLVMVSGKTRVLIDTASDAGVRLGTKSWDNWYRSHADEPYTIDAYSTSMGAVVLTRVLHAEQFKTGALEVDNVLVEQDGIQAAGQQNLNWDISLGLNALSRLMIIVDGPNFVCYVKKLEPVSQTPSYNRLGAVFVPKNIKASDALVAVVADNTPAASAGIRNQDELVKIDDLDVTGWRTTPGIMPLGRFWVKPAGTKFALGLIRDGKSVTIPVTLADFLSAGSGAKK